MLHHMNEDHVTWECDYPHSDTLWPNCPERLMETMQHLTDTQIDKITHKNALTAFRSDAIAQNGGRENCTVGALRAKATNVDTTPRREVPPTITGLPRSSGASRCSIDA